MSKWEFQPETQPPQGKQGVLTVRRVDGTKASKDPITSRTIACTDGANFDLLYNAQNRLCGYKLVYDASRLQSKFVNFNSCLLVFSTHGLSPRLEILYEDQAVRLLCYEFDEGPSDIWLVGRWRE